MDLVKFVAPFTFPDLEICSLKQIYFSHLLLLSNERYELSPYAIM